MFTLSRLVGDDARFAAVGAYGYDLGVNETSDGNVVAPGVQ